MIGPVCFFWDVYSCNRVLSLDREGVYLGLSTQGICLSGIKGDWFEMGLGLRTQSTYLSGVEDGWS